jgi:3-hydroxy acid dehydrogenase/malonic semialdehyde reductase
MFSPERRIACISGASSGIGLASATAFARLGWGLVLGARRVERLREQEDQLRKLGAHEIVSLPLDVTSSESVANFVATAEAKFPHIDLLLNNAGLALGTDRLAQVQEQDWATVLETNVGGVLRMIRGFLPRMIKLNRGHIVNLGSIAGDLVYEGGGAYCASKHALRALTGTLRLELNGTNIRVTSIDPGMVETEFSNVRFGDEAKAKAVYRGMIPLTADDIADCITFAVTRPAHVNIDKITLMPVAQAAPHKVHRQAD